MGLGTLVKDILTVGGSARKRNKRAKKLRNQQNEQIAQNTALAEQMFNRDLGQSRFEGVAADPALVEAQRRALGQTEQVAQQGYTDTDRLAMNQQLNDAARYEQSQRAGLAEQARARGVTGSGIDIASQLAAQQGGADRATQTAADMAVSGRERAYNANQDAAAMAAQQRQQGFGEQSQVAGALDQFGQWRIGQQGQDAASLMNARMGQAQNYGEQAQGMEQAFSEGVDQAVAIGGAIGNAWSGGAAGAATNLAGGGSQAPTSFGHGASTAPFGSGSYRTATQPNAASRFAGLSGARPASMGGQNPAAPAQQPTQPNPAQTPNPGRQRAAAQRAMGRSWRG